MGAWRCSSRVGRPTLRLQGLVGRTDRICRYSVESDRLADIIRSERILWSRVTSGCSGRGGAKVNRRAITLTAQRSRIDMIFPEP